jgi:hypothetical protein
MLKTKILVVALAFANALLCISRADSISFNEKWKDTAQPDGSGGFNIVSQDTLTFSATLTVPGVGAVPSSEAGNFNLGLSFGDVSFSDVISDADSQSPGAATFFIWSLNNDTGNQVKIGQVTFARANNTLTITAQWQNPLAADPKAAVADYYFGTDGPIHDQQEFQFAISGALDYNLHKTIYVNGTDTVTNHPDAGPLDTVQISGSADFTPPALTFISPTAGARVTSNLVTVIARATDNKEVSDVQFKLGDDDLESGTQVDSNLWSMEFDLSPGTNVIRAFAVDATGNYSSTNTLKVTYVIVAPLELNVIGHGSVLGATNGQLLEIGRSYTLTATNSVRGFAFSNWTDTIGTLLPGIKKLQFIMESNFWCTATFVDVQRPICIITNPVTNKRVSNAVFTVSGKASDNAGVAGVFYKFNTNDWIAAPTSNYWTNWFTLDLQLIPGTNVISAYSVDTTGMVSLTNTVRFIYVVSDRLAVFINGSGVVTQNLNGQMLEIGKKYSMTAVPSKGYGFLNWNGAGGVITNYPKLTFTMVSNLWFQANFVDIARPVNVILTPTANETETNPVLIATGKATDNVGVSNVLFRINGGSWNEANLIGTNWSTPDFGSALLSGSNLISAFATDMAGNISLTNTVRFRYVIQPVADFAPDSLNGLLASVTMDNSSPEKVAFDLTTFAQASSTNNNDSDDWGVGNYIYVKTDTNTAQLSLAFTSPPNKTNESVGPLNLIFTNHYAGYFTNDEESGGFSLIIPNPTVPLSLAGRTLVANETGSNGTNTIKFLNGTAFTATKTGGSSSHTSSGFYTYSRFSPVGAMVAFTFTNTADAGTSVYAQLQFTNNTAGTFLVTRFDDLGVMQDTRAGRFILK